MADPRGFLKVTNRETAKRRPVEVRIMDWKEVYEKRDQGTLKQQASRCMDCGVPFCHQGCPLGNLIPEWNDLTWRGDGKGAIERLHATNNFPEFTGRLCPAPCESSCVLGINQPAVTIKEVEVSIIDQAFENDWVQPHAPERLTGKTVAVVGSGPAGLAAAQQLTRSGHTVAVYERDDKIAWKSSAPGVVRVSEDGVVNAVAPGFIATPMTDVLKDDRVYLAPSISWRGERSTLTLLASYQHDKTGSSQQFLPLAATLHAAPGRRLDQLNVDAKAIPSAANAAHKEIANVEQVPDFRGR